MGFFDGRRIDEGLVELFELWLEQKSMLGSFALVIHPPKDRFATFFAPNARLESTYLKKTYGKIVSANVSRILAEAGPAKPTLAEIGSHKAIVACLSTCAKDADKKLGVLFKTFLKSSYCEAAMVKEIKKHKFTNAVGLPEKAAKDLVPAVIAIKQYEPNADVDKLIQAVQKKYKEKPGSVQAKIKAIQAKINKDTKIPKPKG